MPIVCGDTQIWVHVCLVRQARTTKNKGMVYSWLHFPENTSAAHLSCESVTSLYLLKSRKQLFMKHVTGSRHAMKLGSVLEIH